VRTGYNVQHLAGPSKVCHPAPLFHDQAEAERYADLQDRIRGRRLLEHIDARTPGLATQEDADQYLDELADAERWEPDSDPYALYAHVLWEYDAQDTCSDDGDLIMDEGLDSVPTLAQVADWLTRRQERA
jgi:hypothetical protein